MRMKWKALFLFMIFQLSITVQIASAATSYFANTPEEALTAAETAIANKEEDFTIQYGKEMTADEIDNTGKKLINVDNALQDVINADYGIYNIKTCTVTNEYINNSSDQTSYYQSSIDPEYRETREQTKYVYDTIHKLIRDNISSLTSEYDKAYWAYKYITDHVVYDKSLQNPTAYDALYLGKATCQGFSLLYYAMATELGLDCHIMTGADHSWNMVKIDNQWYCVDSTWGAKVFDKYFLIALSSFTDDVHISSDSFNNYFNYAKSDYVNKGDSKVKGVLASNYNIEFDIAKKISMYSGSVYPWMKNNPDSISLSFSSDDNNIAKVDASGRITAVRTGTTTVKALNAQLNIEQDCEITVKPGVEDITNVKKMTVSYGKSKAIAINVTPSNVGFKGVTFKSGDDTVATVNEDGIVKGTGIGKTAIIVTYCGNKTLEVPITVTPFIIRGYQNLNLTKGKSCYIKDKVIIDVCDAKYMHTSFQSSNKKVVKIVKKNWINAIGKGECKVYVYDTYTYKIIATLNVKVSK